MKYQTTYRVIVRTRDGHKALRVKASSDIRAALCAAQQYTEAVVICVTR